MAEEVTVLIPSYNPGDYLQDAMKSVFKQSYRNWQLILVDDASTDDSLEKVQDYLSHPKVTLIRNNYNLGQSKSMNIGLKQVETPYVIQLDADDWLLPRTLETLVQEARRQPKEVAVISGNIKVVVEEKAVGKREDTPPVFIRKGRNFKDRWDFMLSNASVWPRFYRTEALRSIGGWPTDDPFEGRYMEDKRILMRLIERYSFHWIDQVLYVHRRHEYNQTGKMQAYRYITQWNIKDALKRWGDLYNPVFTDDEDGWLYVVKLIPKQPSVKGSSLRSPEV